MPKGPYGGPRPLADCELVYTARYNIGRGIGASLEENDKRLKAEKLIAQHIDDNTNYDELIIQLNPAGWMLAVDVMLDDNEIASESSRNFQTSFSDLQEATDEAVQQAVDQNATRGEGFDQADWSITTK
jgi:hypothetical protein